jgi:uncharacterized membrane protein HdeD (DUF308 family)
VIGACIALHGVLAIVAGWVEEVPVRRAAPIRGLLEVLVGVLVFAYPFFAAGITAIVFLYSFGLLAVVTGALDLVDAWKWRRVPADVRGLSRELPLGSILVLVFGLVLLIAPFWFGLVLVRIVGLIALLFGTLSLAAAFRLWTISRQWRV